MILHSLSEQRVTKVSLGCDLFQPGPMWLSGQQRGVWGAGKVRSTVYDRSFGITGARAAAGARRNRREYLERQ